MLTIRCLSTIRNHLTFIYFIPINWQSTYSDKVLLSFMPVYWKFPSIIQTSSWLHLSKYQLRPCLKVTTIAYSPPFFFINQCKKTWTKCKILVYHNNDRNFLYYLYSPCVGYNIIVHLLFNFISSHKLLLSVKCTIILLLGDNSTYFLNTHHM